LNQNLPDSGIPTLDSSQRLQALAPDGNFPHPDCAVKYFRDNTVATLYIDGLRNRAV
jgi:hypothetical protein